MHYKIIKYIQRFKHIPNINCGGCGIFALHLYRQIKKYNPKLIKITDNENHYCHYCVYVDGVYYDSENAIETYANNLTLTEITEKELILDNADINRWNKIFDRKYLYEIKKITF